MLLLEDDIDAAILGDDSDVECVLKKIRNPSLSDIHIEDVEVALKDYRSRGMYHHAHIMGALMFAIDTQVGLRAFESNAHDFSPSAFRLFFEVDDREQAKVFLKMASDQGNLFARKIVHLRSGQFVIIKMIFLYLEMLKVSLFERDKTSAIEFYFYSDDYLLRKLGML